MLSLVDRRTTADKGRYGYPDVVAGYTLDVTHLYPPIHIRRSMTG
jgi:hypothetical protein